MAEDLTLTDPSTLTSPVHLVDGVDPVVDEDHIRVVIEIPAGSIQKWEVDKADGNLKWEMKNGSPRNIKYIGYPGNYGLVPRTLLSKERGGDNDPMDIIVLGPPLPRGSIVDVKLIGLLKMQDKGEQDNKLIAVMRNNAFSMVDSIDELDKKFPGVSDIIESWFSNYKGKKKVETFGFSGVKRAHRELEQALGLYTLAKPERVNRQ